MSGLISSTVEKLGKALHDSQQTVRRLPMRYESRGRVIRATLMVPRRGKPPLAVRGYALLPAGTELGWFGSSWVRKGKAAVKKVVNPVVDVAKDVARSRVAAQLAKMAPTIANAIPPPYGTAISAGITAGQVTAKIVKAAKAGNKLAKAAIARSKQLNDAQERARAQVRRGADQLKRKRVPAPAAARALRHRANTLGVYVVRSPDGRVRRFRASEL